MYSNNANDFLDDDDSKSFRSLGFDPMEKETKKTFSSSLLEDEPVMRSIGGIMTNDLMHNVDLDDIEATQNDWSMLSDDLYRPQMAKGKLDNNAFNFYDEFSTSKVDINVNYETTTTTIIEKEEDSISISKLPNEPMFLERYTSFYCLPIDDETVMTPNTVLNAISQALKSCENETLKLSTQLCQQKSLIKGTAYVKNSPITFVVQLYQPKTQKDLHQDQILVECQRRSGDSFYFQRLYRQLLIQLSKYNTNNFKN